MPYRCCAHAAALPRAACASLPCRCRVSLPCRCRNPPPHCTRCCVAAATRATPPLRAPRAPRRHPAASLCCAVPPCCPTVALCRAVPPQRPAVPSRRSTTLPQRPAVPPRHSVAPSCRGPLRFFARLVVLPPIPPPGHAIPPPGSPSRRSDAAPPRRFATRRTNGKKIAKTFQYSTVSETRSPLKD